MRRAPSGSRPRRHSLLDRIRRVVRALFRGGSSGWDTWPDDDAGGVGVREPRRPLAPTLTGTAVAELPDDAG